MYGCLGKKKKRKGFVCRAHGDENNNNIRGNTHEGKGGNWGERHDRKNKRRNWKQFCRHKREGFLSERREAVFFFWINAATHLLISCGNPWLSSNSRVSSLPLPLVLPVAVESCPQVRPIASCPSPSQRSSIGSRWHRDGQSILAEGRARPALLLLREKEKGN